RLRAHYLPSQVLHADPLVVKIAGNAHMVVLRFGALVFWQCSEAICSKLLEDIERLLHLGPPASEVRDALRIVVEQAEESVSFREIRLQTLTLEHIKMISEAIGQSVALKQSEASVTLALKKSAPIVRAMEARGELIESAQNIVKTVGFTLAVREAILAKLSLFDDPADTWRSERLARLHGQLQDHFD